MFAYGVTVKVMYTTQDVHGDEVEHLRGLIEGCALAPTSSIEDNDNRAQVDTRMALYAPYSPVEVRDQDKIRVEPTGTSWHVEGEPEEWANAFTGWQPGRVINVRRVKG